MSTLKSVILLANVLNFGTDILGFTQIKGLKKLFLLDGHVLDGLTAESVEALQYNMAVLCPDVMFKLSSDLDPDQLL